jgi:hypothetical protein
MQEVVLSCFISDKSSNERSYSSYGSSKLTYDCLSCGTEVSDRTCRKYGSHMKKWFSR